ncbi:hypothetical protein HGRIS_002853 [Hohenbuehelia grisea]|uniref:rRNA adenine N(6)-methyltransferase n=1 Tax=Hohenbuehelia grisea TaxID=104357 RepID=A0ABR3JLQ2_9AGAR
MDWDSGVHPRLQFISHLPMSVAGEQLAAQLCRSIPDRTWLFKYGRVPMNMLLSDYMWQRLDAGPTSRTRCKVSVIAEAVADLQLALPTSQISPHNRYFHPSYNFTTKLPRQAAQFQAVTITPLAHQIITRKMLDKWDYCLRRLFVLKSQPLKQAISSLAPGASVLLKKLDGTGVDPDDVVDITTPVRRLTVRDWSLIMKAFDEWPFAPEDLSIFESFGAKESRQ